MTFADYRLHEVCVDPFDIYSDHSLVTCRLPIVVGQAAAAERLVRGWRRVDRYVLRTALADSPLCRTVADDADVDELFSQYDDVLRDIAERLAPLHAICRPAARFAPWFDASCRNAWRQCRRLERRSRRYHERHRRRPSSLGRCSSKSFSTVPIQELAGTAVATGSLANTTVAVVVNDAGS